MLKLYQLRNPYRVEKAEKRRERRREREEPNFRRESARTKPPRRTSWPEIQSWCALNGRPGIPSALRNWTKGNKNERPASRRCCSELTPGRVRGSMIQRICPLVALELVAWCRGGLRPWVYGWARLGGQAQPGTGQTRAARLAARGEADRDRRYFATCYKRLVKDQTTDVLESKLGVGGRVVFAGLVAARWFQKCRA